MRLLVISCGGLALIVGALLILTLDIPLILRGLAVTCWLLASGRELYFQVIAYSRISRLRIDSAGGAIGVSRDGEPQVLSLQPGSMVLSRAAWLILRFADGTTYGELLRERPPGAATWRRLRLLCEQRRGAFGANR